MEQNKALETVATLATTRNYARVSKTANIIYIKNCKQFIQCCISDRYKIAIIKNYKHEHYALA